MTNEPNKYKRVINGVTIDVYDVLKAFGVVCPATAHAVKKLLMPGQRGGKDALQDLREARQAIDRAIELAGDEATPLTNEDGWIPWNGGKCPLPPETLTQIRNRNGNEQPANKACFWHWEYEDNKPWEIIAYRVVSP